MAMMMRVDLSLVVVMKIVVMVKVDGRLLPRWGEVVKEFYEG